MCFLAALLARQDIHALCLMLDICNSHINDELMEELAVVFCENPALTLKNNNLGNINIGQNGNNSIARLLRDPMCALEELLLSVHRRINNNAAISLVNSLIKNKSLSVETLDLSGTSITATGFWVWAIFLTSIQ